MAGVGVHAHGSYYHRERGDSLVGTARTMWLARSCVELALLLTRFCALESWPQSLTGESTWENRPCASPGQHNGAASVIGVWVGRPKGVNVGELTLLLISQEVMRPLFPSSRESFPQGYEVRKANPIPCHLQHSGERALHRAWAAQTVLAGPG